MRMVVVYAKGTGVVLAGYTEPRPSGATPPIDLLVDPQIRVPSGNGAAVTTTDIDRNTLAVLASEDAELVEEEFVNLEVHVGSDGKPVLRRIRPDNGK